MQIQKNRINNIGFGAKINVIGSKFDKKALSELSEKASKIGCENDVVELKFSQLYSIMDRNYHWHLQDNYHINDSYNEFRQTFKARFLPNGQDESSKSVINKLFCKSLNEVLEQQKQLAHDYLDNLVKAIKN